MRVLFATNHIHFPQGGGGMERNTHELCLGLQARGLVPGVMSSLVPDGSLLAQTNRLKRFLLRQKYPRDRVRGYAVFRGWSREGVPEVVARFRPDLAVVQAIYPEELVRRFAGCAVPTAVYIHEVVEIDHLRPLGEQGFPFLANSSFTAARLRERCGIEANVFPPLVDPSQYLTETRRERVLFVNTVPRKGLEIALRLAEARPDIPFDFVLAWILTHEQVQDLKTRAQAAGNVTLHPPTRDMRPLYARARILLAPSQVEEAWGRVATEAHINGIPVLGSTSGGLPEAVGPGGILLPADAPDADWLAALGRLWDDKASYMRYVQAALDHAKRPEIQPGAILDALCDTLRRIRQKQAAPKAALRGTALPLPQPDPALSGPVARHSADRT